MLLESENKKGRLTMNKLSKLPDEIVMSILSRLTMKEVARSRLVSRKWDHYCRHIQVLNFEDPIAFKKMVNDAIEICDNYYQVMKKVRCDFVNWVNNVLNKHLGFIVDEFKLVWFLNAVNQHVVDTWLAWASSKHVEKLHLDFSPPKVIYNIPDQEKYLYLLDLPLLQSCTTKFHLTSLRLNFMDVTTQAMECILLTCGPTLVYLCLENCYVLTSIAAASLPSLKYFKLHDCPKLKTIHIKAPKLVTFEYFSSPHHYLSLFNIENASMLSHVDIHVRGEGFFFQILRSLFKYFSHLEYLKLNWFETPHCPVLENFPALANLKDLILIAVIPPKKTMDAWVPFIGACPLLQSLTLQVFPRRCTVWPKIECHKKCPLLYLKTFEIKYFNGYNVDLDIANFVLQNAPSLEEVILSIDSETTMFPVNLEAPFAAVGLKLPPHVNLVIV